MSSVPAYFQKFNLEAQKILDFLKKEFVTIRTGRASPVILDRVRVEAYGNEMPINQLATVSVAEARILEIRPWDPQVASAIEKAIQKSDLGLTPASDGGVIRIAFPPLTQERRQEYAKVAGKYGEEARVKIRHARHLAQEEMIQAPLKEKKIPEDEKFKRQNELNQLTNKFIADVDALFAAKEKEILEV